MKVNGIILRKIEVIEETLRELRNLDKFIVEVRSYAKNQS